MSASTSLIQKRRNPTPPTTALDLVEGNIDNEPIVCFTCRKILSENEKKLRNSFNTDLYEKTFQKVFRLVNSSRKPRNRRTTSWDSDKLGYFCTICRSLAYQLYDLSQSLTNHKRSNGDEVKRLEHAIQDLEKRILFKNLGKELDKGFNFVEKAEKCFQNKDLPGYWNTQFLETVFSKYMRNPKKINQLKAKYGIQSEPDGMNHKKSLSITQAGETLNDVSVSTDSSIDAVTDDYLEEPTTSTYNKTFETQTSTLVTSPPASKKAEQSSPVAQARHRSRKQAITSRMDTNIEEDKGSQNVLGMPEDLLNQPQPVQGDMVQTENIEHQVDIDEIDEIDLDVNVESPLEFSEQALVDSPPGKISEETKLGIFSCPTCDKSFNSRSGLNGHIWVHRKPYCPSCRQFFLTSEDLESHNRAAHPENGRHFCYICQKMFNQMSKLVVHLRCHKHISSYSCAAVNCLETFRTKLECVRHMKVCSFIPKTPKRPRKRYRNNRAGIGIPKRKQSLVDFTLNGTEVDLIELTPNESDNEMPYFLMECSDDYGMEIEEAEPFA